MLRFIACEDNPQFLQKITEVVNKVMMPYDFDYKVNKFTSYTKELEDIIKNKNEQKVYILDVEMPDVSGLEIASNIREEDIDSVILFITAHSQYKNDVFYSRLLALDYIQKGALWDDRLIETLKYTVKMLNRKQILTFKYYTNIYREPLSEINYIEKVQDKKMCIIYTVSGEELPIPETLVTVEHIVGPLFYKCHKSFLVNVENIKNINYSDNTITFQNNKSAYLVSNRCKKGLKDYVEKY